METAKLRTQSFAMRSAYLPPESSSNATPRLQSNERRSVMRIGILGSGLMGAKLGTLFARAGHAAVFSYARSRDKLAGPARDAGARARAGTPREAAEHAEAVLLAVHWSRVDEVLKQAGDLSGKVVVSCSLPMKNDDS